MIIRSQHLRRGMTVALVAAFIFGPAFAAPAASAAPADCVTVGRAVQVSADCIDATYSNPVIDSDTDETVPIPHHRVRGHFEGTNIEFNIYLHSVENKAQWQGRFFQSTYPISFSPSENTARATDRQLEFSLASGGYAVQAGNSSVSIGYRHDAAAAKFARTVAAQYYSTDAPIWGYLYGGSGGSLQTIGAAENTDGVWQGFVPTIVAVPQPSSYNFLGRAAAELILSDKAADIRAALLPGGSGDPYATLTEGQRTMLTEVHALGIPWKGWEHPAYLLGIDQTFYPNGFSTAAPLGGDPSYLEDFWSTPGYLGTEQSPLGDLVRAKLAERGDTLENRWDIANRFYYRYLLPPAADRWTGLAQFRGADGAPLYPQRPVAPSTSNPAAGGGTYDGSVNGKVIAVSNLYDTDALPLHTDWYRKRVEASLGTAAAANTFRVYFDDHADHQGTPAPGDERSKHLVDPFSGAEQALRDIAAWAEDGIEPPASTEYSLEDGQVVVPDAASERQGIQPTVDLTVDGQRTVTVRAGESVALTGVADAPPGTARIITAEWDFDGDGVFAEVPLADINSETTIEASPVFDTPGTYLVALRATSERHGDPSAQFARVQNLDRVQVVVTAAPCAVDCGTITPGTIMITGEAAVGNELRADSGAWNPADAALTYQWLANDVPIDGATDDTVTPGAAQAGARVTVTVSGSKTGWTSASVTSDPSDPVAALPPATSSPAPPSSGDPDTTATGGELARTGTRAAGVVGLASVLLLGGVSAIMMRARRNRVQP